MARKKTKSSPKPKSEFPFVGRWRIDAMSEWDDEYINEEVPAYIEFKDQQMGGFQFAYVRGEIDYRITTRDGEPAVEWSWEGNDDQDDMSGRGWAALRGDDDLIGEIFIHGGDGSGFTAERAPRRAGKKS